MIQRPTILSLIIATGILGTTPGSAHPVVRTPRALTTSDSAEIALGAALVAQFDKDRGVIPSPQSKRIEAYLQSIADSFVRAASMSAAENSESLTVVLWRTGQAQYYALITSDSHSSTEDFSLSRKS